MHGKKPAVSTLYHHVGRLGLAPFLSAGVSPKGFRALLAVVLDVRLDRYQAAITCPIATSDSSRKVKQATAPGLLLRELRLRARRKWRGGGKERLKRVYSPRYWDLECRG